MNLLILDGPADPRSPHSYPYRGTYRAHPTYNDSVPPGHEINQLFTWYLAEGGESGVINDVAKALRYATLLNLHPLPQANHFEVVEVVDDHQPESGGYLLGFDLSSGFSNSLLWWWGPEPIAEPSPSVPEPVNVLADLMYRYYAPCRNQYGLFPTAIIASRCLSAMDALQRLSPNLFEGQDLRSHFWPVALYLVPGQT